MPSFEAEITSERIGPLPWGDAVATIDRPAGTVALSLANLHPAELLECLIWVPGRTGPAADADGRLARDLQ